MKLNISSTDLLKGLLDVSKAIPTKSPLPILENFLFVLKDGKLEVTASDSELTLRTSIEVEGAEEDGNIAVPARHMIDLLKELPDQPVRIRTVSDSSFECAWASGNSVLPYFPADDYPEIKGTGEDAQTVVFPAASLVEGIQGTVYATADDEIRPAMNGIFFDIDTASTTLVASDSHKLICYTTPDVKAASLGSADSLSACVERGLKDGAAAFAAQMLKEHSALDIINSELIPGLNKVGKDFETGKAFLPQLLMSAEAAKSAFEVLKSHMAGAGEVREKKGTIVLATVKGDIHDIGKNIVKVLLENYDYEVIDLGKDVDPSVIVSAVVEKHAEYCGLSALMTTTVPAMEETIKQLREAAPWCKVMVGGAVMTQAYADMIGADAYCKDAMAGVNYAERN